MTGDQVFTLTEAAALLKLTHRRGAKKGQPDRRAVMELVAAGKLRLVDPDQPVWRQTIAAAEIAKYVGQESA